MKPKKGHRVKSCTSRWLKKHSSKVFQGQKQKNKRQKRLAAGNKQSNFQTITSCSCVTLWPSSATHYSTRTDRTVNYYFRILRGSYVHVYYYLYCITYLAFARLTLYPRKKDIRDTVNNFEIEQNYNLVINIWRFGPRLQVQVFFFIGNGLGLPVISEQ